MSKENKYGFVYIWYDGKRKMYYIGSHWGTENDGYICSSNRMRDAYRRRPKDFKRRILKVVSDRTKLLETEYEYLSMIEENELGKKYYNLTNHKNGHWSSYPEKVKTLSEKISHKTKEAMVKPEVRQKYEKGLQKRDNKSSNPEVIEKRRQSMIKTMAKKFPIENRYKPLTDEEKWEYYSQKGKEIWANRTEEQKKEIGRKISEANKRNKRENVTCPHCGKTGNPIVMPRWHFDNCKAKTNA
jgi:hypothetical protein